MPITIDNPQSKIYANFIGDGSGITAINASNVTSGTLISSVIPDLSDTYLKLSAVQNVITGQKLYFSKVPIATPVISHTNITANGGGIGYDYMEYYFIASSTDGQTAWGINYWDGEDDGVVAIQINFPAAVSGQTYKLYRFRDSLGYTCKLGTWTSSNLPSSFTDDFSNSTYEDATPAPTNVPTRRLDNTANSLRLDGVAVSAASFTGSGAGLTNVPSPFNQSLNTNSSVQFNSVFIKGGTTTFNGTASPILKFQGQNGYPGGGTTELGNITNYGQFTLISQLGSSFGPVGTKQSQFIFNQSFYQSGNYPISTFLIDYVPVDGYWGSGRICYVDFTQNGNTMFAIDRYGKLQWTTTSTEGLYRDSTDAALKYMTSTGKLSVLGPYLQGEKLNLNTTSGSGVANIEYLNSDNVTSGLIIKAKSGNSDTNETYPAIKIVDSTSVTRAVITSFGGILGFGVGTIGGSAFLSDDSNPNKYVGLNFGSGSEIGWNSSSTYFGTKVLRMYKDSSHRLNITGGGMKVTAGNVGIGGDASAKLDVYGDVIVRGNLNTSTGMHQFDDNLYFYDNSYGENVASICGGNGDEYGLNVYGNFHAYNSANFDGQTYYYGQANYYQPVYFNTTASFTGPNTFGAVNSFNVGQSGYLKLVGTGTNLNGFNQAVNSCYFFQLNSFFNGGNFQRDKAGGCSLIQADSSGISLSTAVSAAAGTAVTYDYNFLYSGGKVAIGKGYNAAAQTLELNSTTNYQLRLGNGQNSAIYTYDIGRHNTTGHLIFTGNQSGAIGYDFDGAITTTSDVVVGGKLTLKTTTASGTTQTISAAGCNNINFTATANTTLTLSGGTDQQALRIRFVQGGSANYTLAITNANFGTGITDLTGCTQSTVGKYAYVGLVFNGGNSKWDVVSVATGFTT